MIDVSQNKLIWKICTSQIEKLENDSFFSADWINDNTLCVTTANGFVFLNADTFKVTRTLRPLGKSTQFIAKEPYSFNVSPGNGLMAYDPSLGTLLFRDDHPGSVSIFGVSPDGGQLLYNSQRLNILNLTDWTTTEDIIGQAAGNLPSYLIDACWLDSRQIAAIESRWSNKESRYHYFIVVCSLENPTEKWEVESSVSTANLPRLDGHISTVNYRGDTFLLTTLGDEVSLISTDKKGLYNREIYPDFVVQAYRETDQTLLIGTNDGKLYRQEITAPSNSVKNYSEAGGVYGEIHSFTYDPLSGLAVLTLEKDNQLIFLSPYKDPDIQDCQTDGTWLEVQYETCGNNETYRIITERHPEEKTDTHSRNKQEPSCLPPALQPKEMTNTNSQIKQETSCLTPGLQPKEMTDTNSQIRVMKAGESTELYCILAPYYGPEAVKCKKIVQKEGRAVFLYCTQSDQGGLTLHAADLETCQELYTKPLDVPFNEYSIEAAFDHRGEQLLITGYPYPKEQLGYLFTTGAEEKDPSPIPFQNEGYLRSARFSPDDKKILLIMENTGKNGVASWLHEYCHLTWNISEKRYFQYEFPGNMVGPDYSPSLPPVYIWKILRCHCRT